MKDKIEPNIDLVSPALEENWWSQDYGFFGEHYLEGDNSQKGYLINKVQSLEERTTAEACGVRDILNLKNGESILDVPCGYGRHSIELSKMGFNVTGVDINEVHLNVARKNSDKLDTSLSFSHGNMLTLDFAKKFDAIINMFYSFGFFISDEENMQTLRNFYNALKNGGRFLMHTDVNIPRILSGKYKEIEKRELISGNELEIRDYYNKETKRIEGTWIIHKKDGSKTQKDYSVRVYTKEEFMEMCIDVGFKRCEAYSSWDGQPYDSDSEDMIIVAYK
jgi:ubiquinone/menaquinone biosynthesis C-methylase UbiE